ncbi:MAG: alpha-amylase family glycosyl hydrolase, partial [Anaerolineales bacterium]
FNDSDGDGIGDFNGITQKLDYLASLGINALWLMPINPATSYHGYDVTNYYAVNPEYGSMEDFQTLLSEAHQRGIRIILDLVLNHTSVEHPWFVDANGNPDSPYRGWYLWADSYPGYNGPFGTAWHAAKGGGYYYGVFWSGMPDLNYTNPEVTAEMHEVTRYWLEDIGVDGFRIDAARHLIEDGQKASDTPATLQWFADYYQFYKGINPNAYTVSEIYGAGALIAKNYEGRADHIFNFELASGIVNSVNGEANSSITSAIKFMLKDKPDGNFATFLTNHDQDRVMSVLSGKVEKAKVAAAMLLTAPGTPFIYYGEEIGLQGRKPDPDIRRPMQWSDAPNAGFTSAAQAWRDPFNDYPTVNVAAQENDPASLLNHYRTLIALRKAYPALQIGSTALIEPGSRNVYAILRSEGSQVILVLVNLSGAPVSEYALSLSNAPMPDGTYTLEAIFGDGTAQPLTVSGGAFTGFQPIPELAPYSVHIYLLK